MPSTHIALLKHDLVLSYWKCALMNISKVYLILPNFGSAYSAASRLRCNTISPLGVALCLLALVVSSTLSVMNFHFAPRYAAAISCKKAHVFQPECQVSQTQCGQGAIWVVA